MPGNSYDLKCSLFNLYNLQFAANLLPVDVHLGLDVPMVATCKLNDFKINIFEDAEQMWNDELVA